MNSRGEIYHFIHHLASEGMACLVISSDLEEIIEFGMAKGFVFMTATEALQYWQKNGWQSMSVDQLNDFSLFDEGWDFLYLHFLTFLFAFIIFAFLFFGTFILIKKHFKKAAREKAAF